MKRLAHGFESWVVELGGPARTTVTLFRFERAVEHRVWGRGLDARFLELWDPFAQQEPQ